MMPYRKFAFPLNVYARAIELEEGHVDYLHYGLFRTPDEPFDSAQRHSTELLIEHLPPSPAHILEVGIGLGKTAGLLSGLGYRITGITPDPAQITEARRRAGDAELSCVRWEEYEADKGQFDAVLFQESSQYVEPLVLLGKSCALLKTGGCLVMLDEFAMKRTEPGAEGLHLLQHMAAQAGRFGFRLEKHLDLSSHAAPTLDYLLNVVKKHCKRLEADLDLDDAGLDALNASNEAYRKKYEEGRFGYALLVFRKTAEPLWQLRTMTPSDRPAVFELFRQAFGHDMPASLWEWKYGPSNASDVNAWRDGRLAGHYGGLERAVLFFGKPEKAVQIGDVMVHPSERGVLRRKGVFHQMAASFFECNVGYGRPCLASFGFPNERVMRLGEKLGLYGEIDRIVEASWTPLDPGISPFVKVRLLHADSPLLQENVETLWKEMAAGFREGIMGVRDWAYFRHRYFLHPCRRYKVYLASSRIGSRPRGIFVLQKKGDEWELMDLVCPLHEIPLLVRHARRMTGSLGGKKLTCWMTSAISKYFGRRLELRDIGIPIATNLSLFGPGLEKMRERWWLMGGDTDFL